MNPFSSKTHSTGGVLQHNLSTHEDLLKGWVFCTETWEIRSLDRVVFVTRATQESNEVAADYDTLFVRIVSSYKDQGVRTEYWSDDPDFDFGLTGDEPDEKRVKRLNKDIRLLIEEATDLDMSGAE